jgi:hypothetical protein
MTEDGAHKKVIIVYYYHNQQVKICAYCFYIVNNH